MGRSILPSYTVDLLSSPGALVFGFSGYLYQALVEYLHKYKTAVVDNEQEMNKYHFNYVFHKDNLPKITKTLYIAQKNNAKFILLLTKENPNSVANIIRMLNKIKADVEIFIFSYLEPTSVDGSRDIIKAMFEDIFVTQKKRILLQGVNYKKIQKTQIETKRRSKKNNLPLPLLSKLFLLGILIFLGLSIYIGAVIGSFYIGVEKINSVQKNILSGKIDLAKKESDQAYALFTFGNKLASFSLPFVKVIAPKEGLVIDNGFRLSQLLAKTISQAAYTTQLAQSVGESIVSSRISLHISQLNTLEQEVAVLNQSVQQLFSEVKSVERANSKLYNFFKINKQLEQSEKTLSNLSTLLSLVSRMSKVLPQVLGYEKPKTFLLLFQNNSELRPTGGFIGSFGWVTFSEGRLIEFKTEDVYSADGQLKGHVPPPEPIKKYLTQENWYLRDSNFDPDFSASAAQAEWFLKHEMNLSFDGVFAFDLNAVSEILRATNGVYVSDYDQEVTADNLFLKTQSASEAGFFPGSTQKRDFIGSVARAMFIKLTSDRIAWPSVINGVKKSLDEKHALLYFHDWVTQELVEEAGWGGRVGSIFCQETNCFADFLMVVEANLGINKANFLVNRNASLIISQSKDSLIHQLVVNYTNESSDYVYPGGTYFSYTRVLVPRQASISKISVGGVEVKDEDVTIEEYQDKLSVGFPMRISGNETKEVRLSYSIPVKQNITNIELLVQKQPGVKTYPLTITVNKIGNELNSVAGSKSYVENIEVISDHLVSFTL